MPAAVCFVDDFQPGKISRLLALECVQDPGNLVRPTASCEGCSAPSAIRPQHTQSLKAFGVIMVSRVH